VVKIVTEDEGRRTAGKLFSKGLIYLISAVVAASSGDAHSLEIGPAGGELVADQANARVERGAAGKKKKGEAKKPKYGRRNRNKKKQNKKKISKNKNPKKRRNNKKWNEKTTKKGQNKNRFKNVKQKQCSSQQADDACLQVWIS
jgi:hypothetical protein